MDDSINRNMRRLKVGPVWANGLLIVALLTHRPNPRWACSTTICHDGHSYNLPVKAFSAKPKKKQMWVWLKNGMPKAWEKNMNRRTCGPHILAFCWARWPNIQSSLTPKNAKSTPSASAEGVSKTNSRGNFSIFNTAQRPSGCGSACRSSLLRRWILHKSGNLMFLQSHLFC